MADLYYIPGAAPSVYLAPGCPFVLDDVQYPANWLASATPADLAAIGAELVKTEGTHGDPRLVINHEIFEGPVRHLTMTPRPAEDLAAERRIIIAARLAEIDATSIRAVRAIITKVETQADYDRLAVLEAEAVNLRAELSTVASSET